MMNLMMKRLFLPVILCVSACGGESEPPPTTRKPVRRVLKKRSGPQAEEKKRKRVVDLEFSRGKLEMKQIARDLTTADWGFLTGMPGCPTMGVHLPASGR